MELMGLYMSNDSPNALSFKIMLDFRYKSSRDVRSAVSVGVGGVMMGFGVSPLAAVNWSRANT